MLSINASRTLTRILSVIRERRRSYVSINIRDLIRSLYPSTSAKELALASRAKAAAQANKLRSLLALTRKPSSPPSSTSNHFSITHTTPSSSQSPSFASSSSTTSSPLSASLSTSSLSPSATTNAASYSTSAGSSGSGGHRLVEDPSLPTYGYEDGKFVSPWCHDTEKDFTKVFTWLSTRKQGKLHFPNLSNPLDVIRPMNVDTAAIATTTKPHVTWMGHASCYFQSDGVYFLTDPMWSGRAAPVQFAGPQRFFPAPIPLENLKIDVVLLSHTHYDHLDVDSAQRIGNRALWIVPLGVKETMNSIGITNCIEMGWWDVHQININNSSSSSSTSSSTSLSSSSSNNTDSGKEIKIVFTPSKHWTSRTPFDRNTALWGGYAVVAPSSRFFFAGDTAYCSVFKTIGDKLGPFDFSFIPIGAYKPRWFMKAAHCNPEEAVQIHKDVQSKKSVAIHWGTFPLADEDVIEPALELGRAREALAVPTNEFFTMGQGETMQLEDNPKHDLASNKPDLYRYYLKIYNEQLEVHKLAEAAKEIKNKT